MMMKSPNQHCLLIILRFIRIQLIILVSGDADVCWRMRTYATRLCCLSAWSSGTQFTRSAGTTALALPVQKDKYWRRGALLARPSSISILRVNDIRIRHVVRIRSRASIIIEVIRIIHVVWCVFPRGAWECLRGENKHTISQNTRELDFFFLPSL